MKKITEDQHNYIVSEVNNSNIESEELKHDLIDHFCCFVEEEIKKGKGFQESYNKAFKNVCPNGFEEIHKETLFLLTAQKILIMKKLLYLSGFFTAIIITTGFLFKYMRWPGQSVLIICGLAALFFLVLPLLIINLNKMELAKVLSNKLKYIFGYLSAAFFLVFVTLKVFHWPGPNVFLGLAVIFFNLGFLPFFFYRMYKKSVE